LLKPAEARGSADIIYPMTGFYLEFSGRGVMADQEVWRTGPGAES